jgi:hypothetical protein
MRCRHASGTCLIVNGDAGGVLVLVASMLTVAAASCGAPVDDSDSAARQNQDSPIAADSGQDSVGGGGVDSTSDSAAGGTAGDGNTVGNSGESGTDAGGDSAGESGATDNPAAASGPLDGYWVWEQRVQGTDVQSGDIDRGQMKIAFGDGNNRCHYIWNETTGSDFHTECHYETDGDMITFEASADPDGTAAGYSCAHPDWTAWNDRPAIEWGRYRFVGDRLWIGVNTYWGFGGGVGSVPPNGSLKRFPFWESQSQATSEDSWIVFRPVTRDEWYTSYAISTQCQGAPDVCAQWPGCGPGDKGYVD